MIEAPEQYTPGQPASPEPPKKKNWFLRHKVLTGIAVLAVLVAPELSTPAPTPKTSFVCTDGGGKPPCAVSDDATKSAASDPVAVVDPPKPVAPRPVAPVLAQEVTQSLFLPYVRSVFPQFRSVSDASIMDLAETACKAFDEGASADDLVTMATRIAVQAHWDDSLTEGVGGILGAGTVAYCPEHKGQWGL